MPVPLDAAIPREAHVENRGEMDIDLILDSVSRCPGTGIDGQSRTSSNPLCSDDDGVCVMMNAMMMPKRATSR